MRDVLVRNGRHERPMLTVLKRYGIGTPDKFDRGLWISENDLQKIESGMKTDKTAFNFYGRTLVDGTNHHNQVELMDFENLFNERR